MQRMVPKGSILLRNLNVSCRQLQKLYAEGGTVFPSASTNAQAAVDFLAKELDVSCESITKWRAHQRRKGTRQSTPAATGEPLDVELMRTAFDDLDLVMSPFLQLAPPAAGASLLQSTSRFVATKNVEAGMFLFSLPVEAALFSGAPSTDDGDLLTEHFLHVDDLIAQLVVEASTPGSSHHHYARCLRRMVRPCHNLPFMKTKTDMESAECLPLWRFFHERMECKPLNGFLATQLTEDEYLWYVSLVMSRRSGHATLIPVLDKLNHSPVPNAYYTMATQSTFCGMDIIDNLVAGVGAEFLFHPHVHVFAINPILRGEEVTISYSSADPRTAEGRDVWRVNWGFVPPSPSEYTELELKTVAEIVSARRLARLGSVFPR